MTLRIGLIGPGGIADHYLVPALRKVAGASFWSVLSRDAGRARAFAQKHGALASAPAFDHIDAFLADPKLDAVIIASPDGLHEAQAVACARAKKHVFVEKPMATSPESARAMLKACDEAGVKLGVAYHLRFHTGHRRLAAEVHHGSLGELRHARVQWTYRAKDASNWRAGKDVGRWWALAGVGTHGLDLLRWMLMPTCGEITELRAVTSRDVFKGPHEETAAVAMRFASGATAELVCSVLFDSTPVLEIFGATASATCEGTLGPHGKGRIRSRGAEFSFTPEDPYQGEIADFVNAIETGRAPEVDGREGLRNVELLSEVA